MIISRVDREQLMHCYYEKAMKRLINWEVAAQKLYPKRGILATQLDDKAVYRRCHLNALAMVQMCTQLSLEGLALMLLRLTFIRAPCPSDWGLWQTPFATLLTQSSSVTNGILLVTKTKKTVLTDNIPLGNKETS